MKKDLIFLRDVNFVLIEEPVSICFDGNNLFTLSKDGSLIYKTFKTGKKVLDLKKVFTLNKKNVPIFMG